MAARSPSTPFAPDRSRRLASVAACVLGLAIAGPAAADWLVLRDGGKVETRGPWRERGKLVVFTDAEGVLRSLRAADVDLEASGEATARAAAPAPKAPPPARREPVLVLTDDQVAHVPPEEMAAEAPAVEERPAGPAREPTAASQPRRPPPVILYSTSWCGWCRRTRTLLSRLEVPFVEKDIEASEQARAEHEAKAGPGAGVPVLDIGGKIVRGFNAEAIQSLVGRRLQPSGASPPR
jgi:glutaredoxin